MLAAITLLPALLAMVGHRIDKFSLPGRRKKTHDIEKGGWARWASAVQKRPVRVALVAAVILGALCVPAASIRLGSADSGNDACLLYTSPSPRDRTRSRMPSSA